MKKAVILLELIISILILSVVGIYSLLFVNDLYTKNSLNLKLLNSKLDLETTNLFLENLLQNSVKITTSSNKISFYEINTNDFKSGNYSGFSLLNESSQQFVFTPSSLISNVDANYIWFTNEHTYEIQESFENDKIYFKDASEVKKIYEHYKLLKKQSQVYLDNENLYLNNNLLLKNVTSFKSDILNSRLTIDVCTNICQKWIILL